MKKVLVLLLVAVAGAAAYRYLLAPMLNTFTPEPGYVSLYDGESLQGWRKIGGDATFFAEGDSIVGRHGPGENTFLRTEKTWGDFSLKMQMRWDEPGNSGILFRAQQRGGDGRAYGYQYELDASDRSWSGGIYDEARRGWLANLEDNKTARQAIRLNDWNDVEIEARGASLKTWINGVPAADIVDALDAEGFIALQVHSGESGVMRWRHIRLKALEEARQTGSELGASGKDTGRDSLLAATEWPGAPDTLQFTDTDIRGEIPPGGVELVSRRQFSDAMLALTVPACAEPTVVRMRYRLDGRGENRSFAEVKVYSDRAEGRIVNSQGEQVMEPEPLPESDSHRVTGLTRGQYAVFTVGERDALRVAQSGLYERGEIQIEPAACGDTFELADVEWQSLKAEPDEPLFYETLDTPPAPVLTPTEALAAFRIAPGFAVELVAAEPLVEDPVAMAWDEYGRLYVVELRGYMPDAYGAGSEEPVGQVVRLEDRDGDGRMDHSDVFLGALVNPRAVAVVNEGILIGEPPHLWLCSLASPQDLCTDKRVVGDYAPDVGKANVEHMENGLLQGLDNWLYNAKSSRRMKLVDGEMQVEEGPLRGQWGIAKDNAGRLLYNHNSTWLQTDLFQGEDLVRAGDTRRYAGLGVNLTPEPDVFSVRVNPGVNRAYLDNTLRPDGRLNKTTGASGLAVYRGDQFPERFAQDAFVPESAGNVVAQFALQTDGIQMSAKQRLYDDPDWGQRDFLASTDERFRPVDAANGPDGTLYIIDMYRGIIQDEHFMTDELREQVFERGLDSPIGLGRIWRVRHSEGKTPAPAVLPADMTTDELVAALGHANGWVRDTAQRLLLAEEADIEPQLVALAQGEGELAAVHAVWTLAGREALSGELVMQLVKDAEPARALQVLRAGADLLSIEQLVDLVRRRGSDDELLQVQLAFALAGREGGNASLLQLLAANWQSEYVRQAVVRAVAGNEPDFLRLLLESEELTQASEAKVALLRDLSANAYVSLRGDMASEAPAPESLQTLLALTQAQDEDQVWRQIALLEGFKRVTATDGFVPAHLPEAPAIFADASVSEDDPLWPARLAGRSAFTWPGDELAMGLKPLSPEQLRLQKRGAAFYSTCAACHGADGGGIDGLAPALAGASWVTGPPEWLARIILQGMSGPVEVNGESFNGVMPAHGHLAELDDSTLAGLMTYLRRSWGNRADPVTVEQVAAIRADTVDRSKPWTAAELQSVPYDRGFSRFVGEYSISFVTMTVSEEEDGLHLSVPMYGGGLLDQVSDTEFRGDAAGERIQLEFALEEDGSVNKMYLLRNGEKLTIRRKGSG